MNFFSCGTNAGNPERARWAHLACSGSQLERRIRLILHARGFSHIIKTVLNSTKWKTSSLSVYFLPECRFFIMFFLWPLTYVIVVNICLLSIWKIRAVVIIIWNTITIPRNTKSPSPQKGLLLPEWLIHHSHQVNTLKGTWCYDCPSSNMLSYWLNNK